MVFTVKVLIHSGEGEDAVEAPLRVCQNASADAITYSFSCPELRSFWPAPQAAIALARYPGPCQSLTGEKCLIG